MSDQQKTPDSGALFDQSGDQNAEQSAVNFEQSLAQLESLVKKLESGELPLEESLKSFETGISLVRQCQTALANAEQRVNVLVEEQGEQHLSPFEDQE